MKTILLLTMLSTGLLASGAADALLSGGGGGAGWAGAGLLVGVLYWLLFHHLPAKDARDTQAGQAKDEQMERVIGTFLREIKDARVSTALNSEKERELRHAERETTNSNTVKMAALLAENTVETRALAQETRALAGSVGNLVIRVERQSAQGSEPHQ